MLEDADSQGVRVGCDQYPYTAGSSWLAYILPYSAQAGGAKAVADRLRDPEVRAGLAKDWEENRAEWEDRGGMRGWTDLLITHCAPRPDVQGKNIAEIITGGTLSFEYARAFCDPFTLICEAPCFYHPAINDTSPPDMVRRDAILQRIEETKGHVGFMQALYDAVKGELTAPSLFGDAIDDILRTSPKELGAQANWARTNPRTAQMATVAEKFDSLVIHRFYRLLGLGMFVRMLDAQMAATGESPSLSSAREAAKAAFETRSTALEAELDYTVVPIQKLVRVQLGSALLAADYAAGRRAKRQVTERE
jgi:hypothetical protein